ncbi:MAG: TonB-dependent receptor [Bacteroidota bacterium]
MKIKFSLFFLFLCPFLLSGQSYVLKGKVTDGSNNQPLPFVNVYRSNISRATTTDYNGNYKLELDSAECDVIFRYMGYETITKRIKFNNSKQATVDVTMKNAMQELSGTVISTSKYEQKLEESITSIQLIKPKLIENRNATRLDQAIEQTPGLTIVDNEPQIRGGSGFSSGMGSRVMILIDEIPILRPDAGRPVWNFIPVEDIEQIEILKGASSVIYGSSAINGAINIRTAYPKEFPETKVNIYSSVYSRPEKTYKTSWEGANPIAYGTNLLHSRRFGNFDLVVSGEFSNAPGYIGSEHPKDSTLNSNLSTKGDYENRARFSFGTRYRFKKIPGLSVGLNGNYMYSENAQTWFWYDADTNMYRSYPNSITRFTERMFYLDPYLKYIKKDGASITLKNRYFNSSNSASSDQSTTSQLLYDELQYSNRFKGFGGLTVTAGIMNLWASSYGKVFSGTFDSNKMFTSENLALYVQFEKKFFDRLIFLIGGRWEYYQIADHQEDKPIFRAGLNYTLTPATFIRASFGQGYRYPSIGERYITTNVGKFGFYPNPDLKSESSWNSELGIKQLFKVAGFMGMIDIAGFYQRYDNYVEFNSGYWGKDFTTGLGFKYLNTGKAQIMGIDASIMGTYKITKNIEMNLLLAYTYSLPQALEPDKIYYSEIDTTHSKPNAILSYANSSSDTTDNLLKYRIQHLGKLDVEINFYKSISIGISSCYYSFMKNIDQFFLDIDHPGYFPSGITQYRKYHQKSIFVFDGRVSYTHKNIKLSLIVSNLMNLEYSLRPMSIAAPRLSTLQLVYKI